MENQVEMEEKTRLINQVLELQHTLEGNKWHTRVQELRERWEDLWIGHVLASLSFVLVPDLSSRVDAVKEENLKLKSENQVLGQYIENLMSASSVFQTTDTKSKRKWDTLGEGAGIKGQQLGKETHAGDITRGFVFSAGSGALRDAHLSLTWVWAHNLIMKNIKWPRPAGGEFNASLIPLCFAAAPSPQVRWGRRHPLIADTITEPVWG